MATSGSVNYSITRSTIISRALQLLGVVEEGGTANANQLSDGADWLNMLIKTWVADPGVQLWTNDHIILFPVKNQKKYSFGTGADRMCRESEFIETELNGAHSSGDTVLTVDSTTGMANSDVIGVQTDSADIHWTTISSVGSSTQLTLTTQLDGAAADNNNIYTYTNAYTWRPRRLLQAWRRTDSGEDIPLNIESRKNYYNLSNKDTTGVANTVYFNPQLDPAQLFVWPKPNDSHTNEVWHLIVQRPLEDMDAAGDNPDFPQEWYLPLVYNLALIMIPVYGAGGVDAGFIANLALRFKTEVSNADTEDTSLFLVPARR